MKQLILNLVVMFLISVARGQNINTMAGTGVSGRLGNGGPASSAQLEKPMRINFDKNNNLLILDNNDQEIRMVDAKGIITTIAGTGTAGFSGDGGPATLAQIFSAAGITTDKVGNIYFSDLDNKRIRKIDISGIITTIAGTGTGGYSGDGGPATAAKLWSPFGVAFDRHDNLIFSDVGSGIRNIDNSGIITTIAGNGTFGYSGDGGPATNASVGDNRALAIGKDGNIYVCDYTYHCIRKIDTFGIISTIAGTPGVAGYSGDGGPATAATFNKLFGIKVDVLNNIYVADLLNNVIRKIDIHGTVTTIVGTGTLGFSGDGGPAISAELNLPSDIAFDKYGGMYITDTKNYRIRNTGCFTPPIATPVTGIDTVCMGSTISLKTTDTGIKWVATNTNATVSAGNVKGIMYGFDTIYHIISTSCGQDTAVHIVRIDQPCALNNLAYHIVNQEAKIYPNPAKDQLKIEGATDCEVNIYNAMGQCIYKLRGVKSIEVINVASFVPALYVVEIVNPSGEKQVKRFVKE